MEYTNQLNNYQKIVVLGDSSVGKTTLIWKYVFDGNAHNQNNGSIHSVNSNSDSPPKNNNIPPGPTIGACQYNKKVQFGKDEIDLRMTQISMHTMAQSGQSQLTQMRGDKKIHEVKRFSSKGPFTAKLQPLNAQLFEANLQIWDTTGQERFRSLTPMYIREAAAAIVVFDLSIEINAEALKFWINMLYTYAPNDVQVWVVGNKIDLLTDKLGGIDKVDKDYIQRKLSLESSLKIYSGKYRYFEVSAIDGTAVQELFTAVAKELIQQEAALNKDKKYSFHLQSSHGDSKYLGTQYKKKQQHKVQQNQSKCSC